MGPEQGKSHFHGMCEKQQILCWATWKI